MISGLHHYALEVPDLAVAEGFLQDFGLETGEKDGSLVAQCPGRNQEQVRLVQAPAKRLHHVAFTLRPGTLDPVREALERAGTPVIEPPPGATGDGLWIRDPDGTAVQLLDEAPAPPRPAAEVLFNVGGSQQRIGVAQWRQATEDVLPRRLGHTLLFTAQPQQMTDFYTQRARPADQRPDPRPGDLPQRRARRPSHLRVHRQHPPRFPSRQLRGAVHRRHRARRGPDARQGPGRRLGPGAAHHRLELLPLQPRPVGLVDRVVLGHRPDRRLLGGRDWEVPPHLWGAPPPDTFLANDEPAS